MTTTHVLLEMASRLIAATENDSISLPLAGRTRATFTLDVARIVGGAITPIIETSPTGADDSWAQLVAFGAVAAAGTTTKTAPADFTISVYERFIRARDSAMTATSAIYEVRVALPFVSAAADSERFTKELRAWGDGFERTVTEAEAIVVREIGDAMDTALAVADAGTLIRRDIVVQAEHAYQRHLLALSGDPAARVSLRQYPRVAPGLLAWLNESEAEPCTVWRGR